MYSFLLKSAALPETAYDFFTYGGKTPVKVDFRGKPAEIRSGTRFGVRPGPNGHIRLILSAAPNRVATIDLATAKKLSQGIVREK